MAPLQHKFDMSMLCTPAETGVHTLSYGDQFVDNDGEMNVVGNRPTERHGLSGGFSHGVTIFLGGVPRSEMHPLPRVNPGIVLALFPNLKADESHEVNMKPGTDCERQGRFAYDHPAPKNRDQPVQLAELDHGVVMFRSQNLKPDLSWEGETNMVGGRPTERRGKRGGFTPGAVIRAGGVARDVRPPCEICHGKVLATSSNLKPDLSHELQLKPGTDERLGRFGSFDHPLPKNHDQPVALQELNHGSLLAQTDAVKPDLEWEGETNTKGGRPTERHGKYGGFHRGVRMWSGGEPRDMSFDAPIANRGIMLFSAA